MGETKSVEKIAEKAESLINKLITALKSDKKIGVAHIYWWTPNGIEHSINSNGCRVIINHR
jgi:hypothetical protein